MPEKFAHLDHLFDKQEEVRPNLLKVEVYFKGGLIAEGSAIDYRGGNNNGKADELSVSQTDK